MTVRHLKIKIKTLSDEARHIRLEESKLKVVVQEKTSHGETYEEAVPGSEWGFKNLKERRELHQHRVLPLRKTSRHNYLAYGFLRGKRYSQVEQASYRLPDYDEVIKLVLKFNSENVEPTVLRQRFAEWFDEISVVRSRSFERRNRKNAERYLRQLARLEEIRSMTQEQINENRALRKAQYTRGRNV